MYQFGLIPLIVLISTPLTSGLVYHCKFKDPSQPRPSVEHGNIHTLSFTKQLPASRISSHYCIVTTDKSDSFLQVKARALGQANGSLHVAIFDSRDSFIGHLGVCANGPEETVTFCPQASGRKYFFSITGTPNMHYNVEVTDYVSEISLNKPESFQASKTATLFKFKPSVDVIQKQLDITVSSQLDVAAYLKVSDICKQAMNTQWLDFSGSYLRLTFDKQGRITLSKASSPSLNTSGFTYIGIALKYQSNLTKSVDMTITSSFDYNYSGPLFFLFFVSLFGGIFVSVWALYCIRDPYMLPQDRLNEQNLEKSPSSRRDIEAGNIYESRPPSEVRPRKPLTRKERLRAMRKVFCDHWIGEGPKTFSYTTCIVGFVLLIGAFQFVFEAWKGMIESGDRDRCYYNDFCYRVSGFDIPFNLMISNLVYMIHGIILAFCVLWIEAGSHPHPRHAANGNDAVSLKAKAYVAKQSLSIGYSLAWALFFQGCFSMVYHLCPKQLTFQFDSAFMFVISGLIIVSLTLKRSGDVQEKVQPLVCCNTFYLFFIVPLFVLNYLGALLYSSDMYRIIFVEIVIICLMGYYLTLISWAGMKLLWDNSFSRHHNAKMKFGFLIALLILVIVVSIVQRGNYPQILLCGCIFAALLAICSKVIVPFRRSTSNSDSKLNDDAIHFLQPLYVVVTFVIMITAAMIYHFKAATDKEKSPSESRDLNHDCVLLGFFDYHDLWHILSSFSLLMVAYFVLYFNR
ncbi:cholesterol uptake protein 1-like [Acropora millepora]|uniref:cholesterol uptake protein 1-like n=1 Tax=Acropora millepora TaxID=45264 RepID=UPI001CF1B2F9|nr:cholesterol uptake protein 1-like [Acropora millepora]